jgi:hypothetical protein
MEYNMKKATESNGKDNRVRNRIHVQLLLPTHALAHALAQQSIDVIVIVVVTRDLHLALVNEDVVHVVLVHGHLVEDYEEIKIDPVTAAADLEVVDVKEGMIKEARANLLSNLELVVHLLNGLSVLNNVS